MFQKYEILSKNLTALKWFEVRNALAKDGVGCLAVLPSHQRLTCERCSSAQIQVPPVTVSSRWALDMLYHSTAVCTDSLQRQPLDELFCQWLTWPWTPGKGSLSLRTALGSSFTRAASLLG